MNNVGDIKTFTINGTQTDGLTYVWKWWDGSVDATTVPQAQKKLNMGGDPRWSGTLPVQVEVVDALGRSGQYNSSIVVNNPPQLVPGTAMVDPNGKFVTYETVIKATVYDLLNQPLSFAWSSGDLSLGAGNQTSVGLVDAYWNGTYVGQANGYEASFPHTVDGSTELTLTVVNAGGGELVITLPVYGFERSDTYFAPSAGPESQTGDASSVPVVTVGENASFSIYTSNSNRTVFSWGFWGTNGWSIAHSTNGSTTLLPDGTWRNTVLKTTTGESPGSKLAEVVAYDLDHDVFSVVTIPVTVLSNDPPDALSYEISPIVPIAGDWIRFRANYTDPNRDIVTTRWEFSSPYLFVWGRTAWVDTAGMTSGQEVNGKFTVYDRLGASDEITFSIILA